MVNRRQGSSPTDITARRIEELHRIMVSRDSMAEMKQNSAVMMELLSRRVNITLSKEIKRSYCKVCHNPYTSPTIRIRRNLVRVTCNHCGNIRRMPY
ncbi:MAG: hypothetical protein M1431_03145 [Candidatus Thermoplasmatota archaeon]|nr:hypothetical protein [Candidatus Thermoplasmatota archaeon]